MDNNEPRAPRFFPSFNNNRILRSHVNELIAISHKTAHFEHLAEKEIWRFIDCAITLANSINAGDTAKKLEEVNDEFIQFIKGNSNLRKNQSSINLTNSETSLPEKSRTIIEYLVKIAKNENTATYAETGEQIGELAKNVPQYLDEINDETNYQNCILLSILVVSAKTKRPSHGFYRKAKERWGRDLHFNDKASCEGFFQNECKKIYELARKGELNNLINNERNHHD